MADYIYACHFSDGQIKVGRSANPDKRIKVHQNLVKKHGASLIAYQSAGCTNRSSYAEKLLIAMCAEKATDRNKREWFSGLDFQVVLQWMAGCSKKQPVIKVKVKKPKTLASSIRLPHETWDQLHQLWAVHGRMWFINIILQEHRKTFGETK